MALYMVATIRRDFDEIIGVRLYDTGVKQTRDYMLGGIVQAMKLNADKELIKNLGIDSDSNIVGLNGKLDRYAKVIPNVGVVGQSTVVIVKEYLNGDFEVVNGIGESTRMPSDSLIRYGDTEGIANGSIVKTDTGVYIRSISGEFEKEIAKDNEKLRAKAEAKLNLTQNSKYVLDNGKFKCIDDTLTKVKVPDGVVELADFAFVGNKELAELILPSSIRNLGYMPFKGCKSFKVLKLPYGFERFNGNELEKSSITDIYLPNSMTYIGNALLKALNLKNVYYSNRDIRGLIKVKPNVKVHFINS